MTYPGVALVVMVGVGLGAFLYYMFADGNTANGPHRYGDDGEGYGAPPSDGPRPWCTGQDERTRRRRRRSSVSIGKVSCTICLAELADKDSIQLYPCRHEFHKACISKWREQGPSEARNTCPNCREGIFGSMKW